MNFQKSPDEVEIKLRDNKVPLNDLRQNPNDKADEQLNGKNIELCEVLKPLVVKPDINAFIVETAKQNKGEVTYIQLFTQFPELKALFNNTIIGHRFQEALTIRGGNNVDFERNGYQYSSILYVPNYGNAIATNQAILSPEIASPSQETGQGDVCFGWNLQNGQTNRGVVIDEGESQRTSVPLIVTSLRDETPRKPTTDTPSPSAEAGSNWKRVSRSGLVGGGNSLQTRGGIDDLHVVFIPEAKLNYNYDNGSNPDLYFTGAWINNNGQEWNWARRGCEILELSDVEAECSFLSTNEHRGYTFYDWYFGGKINNQNFWRDKVYFFNAWERDWYCTNKDLGKATHAGVTANFQGDRKYTDEWYIYADDKLMRLPDALPMLGMFNDPGGIFYPNSDPDPFPGSSPCPALGVKAEMKFSRGIRY